MVNVIMEESQRKIIHSNFFNNTKLTWFSDKSERRITKVTGYKGNESFPQTRIFKPLYHFKLMA